MIFRLIVVLVLSIIVAAFAVANSTVVSVNLIFWQTRQMSLSIVILTCVVIGVIFTGLIGIYQKTLDNFKIYKLEAKIRELEQNKTEK